MAAWEAPLEDEVRVYSWHCGRKQELDSDMQTCRHAEAVEEFTGGRVVDE